MKKWTKRAEADKLRYQEEMKDYVPMDEPDGKRKKAKKGTWTAIYLMHNE